MVVGKCVFAFLLQLDGYFIGLRHIRDATPRPADFGRSSDVGAGLSVHD
jgi:hypothetical protein